MTATMTATSETHALNVTISIDDFISECPPREILLRMLSQDDFSTANAVEEILALTRAAGEEAAAAARNGEQRNTALLQHADIVTAILIALAKRIPHDQQSKLVDFTVRLGQTTVPDPAGGGVLGLKEGRATTPFWSGMPRLSINLAEEWLRNSGVTHDNPVKNLDYENLVAYFAQLAEVKFWGLFKDTSWDYPQLTHLFEKGGITRHIVRVSCMWFVHAPKKVWTDVQLRRRDDEYFFEPEFWPRWKQHLQDYQQKLSDDGSDKELQGLISCSLDNMNKTEAELGK